MFTKRALVLVVCCQLGLITICKHSCPSNHIFSPKNVRQFIQN